MENNNPSTPKGKKSSRAGIVLLVILLILAGAGYYLYYSVVKAPLQTDDPVKMAASAPMSPEERFCFFPENQTVQVKLNAGDFWSLIVNQAGSDILGMVNKELSGYPIALSGCAIRMEEDGLWLDVEACYQDTRLVGRVLCTLEAGAERVTVIPEKVKLGILPLPVGGLLSNAKLEFDLALPVLSEITGIRYEKGAVLLTGTMGEDIRSLVPEERSIRQAQVFRADMQFAADALLTEAGYASLFTRLQQNPGSIEDFYRDLFALSQPETIKAYLEAGHGLTERFFPGIDFSALEAEQTALHGEIREQSILLEQFFTRLVGDYNEKKFRLSEGEFLINRKPFEAVGYAQGQFDALFEALPGDSFFLILVDAEDGYIRKTSSFYRIADENQQFTQPVDYNKTYILGCVFRGVSGKPFLLYEREITGSNTYSREIGWVALTEAEVSNLRQPGIFGVWVG